MPAQEARRRALVCATHISTGLEALHEAGFVHCDVKGPNIFVDHDGAFRLGDYGSAVAVGDRVKQFSPSMLPEDSRDVLLEEGAQPKLDKLCLVVTTLQSLGALTPGTAFTNADMHGALEEAGKADAKVYSFLTSLL
jgi:serine/threonine protein kinase